MLALTSPAYVLFICKTHLIQSTSNNRSALFRLIGKNGSRSRVSVVQKLPIVDVY